MDDQGDGNLFFLPPLWRAKRNPVYVLMRNKMNSTLHSEPCESMWELFTLPLLCSVAFEDKWGRRVEDNMDLGEEEVRWTHDSERDTPFTLHGGFFRCANCMKRERSLIAFQLPTIYLHSVSPFSGPLLGSLSEKSLSLSLICNQNGTITAHPQTPPRHSSPHPLLLPPLCCHISHFML